MYDPSDFVESVIDDALQDLRAISGQSKMWSYEAQLNTLAISFQESNLEHRAQHPSGPAKGFWQFEGGAQQALDLIIKHQVVGPWLKEYCDQQVLVCDLATLYAAIQYHDRLAAVLARLLLYTDWRELSGDEQLGWEIYLDCWQPGKPKPERWPSSWEQALAVLDPVVA